MRTVLRTGDLLLTKSSGSTSHIGKTTLVGPEVEALQAGFSNFMQRLRPADRLRPKFLWYLFRSRWIRDQIDLASTTTTGLANLTSAVIGEFLAPVPPLSAQDACITFLDRETAEIDAFIADQEALIALLAERRAATISQAVTKGLDLSAPMKDSGVEWLPRVPLDWKLRPLWQMFERIKDVGHPAEQMLSVFREHGVVIKADYENLNKTAENRNIYQLVHNGWLVANRMKAWQGSVGISSHRGIVSGHYICFRPRHKESDQFLNMLFRSRAYTDGYGTLSRGVRIGQAEIDNDLYRLMPVLLPPKEEQEAIVEYVARATAEINAAIEDAREAIALSKERRAALISAAVTGKIDVRNHGGVE